MAIGLPPTRPQRQKQQPLMQNFLLRKPGHPDYDPEMDGSMMNLPNATGQGGFKNLLGSPGSRAAIPQLPPLVPAFDEPMQVPNQATPVAPTPALPPVAPAVMPAATGTAATPTSSVRHMQIARARETNPHDLALLQQGVEADRQMEANQQAAQARFQRLPSANIYSQQLPDEAVAMQGTMLGAAPGPQNSAAIRGARDAAAYDRTGLADSLGYQQGYQSTLGPQVGTVGLPPVETQEQEIARLQGERAAKIAEGQQRYNQTIANADPGREYKQDYDPETGSIIGTNRYHPSKLRTHAEQKAEAGRSRLARNQDKFNAGRAANYGRTRGLPPAVATDSISGMDKQKSGEDLTDSERYALNPQKYQQDQEQDLQRTLAMAQILSSIGQGADPAGAMRAMAPALQASGLYGNEQSRGAGQPMGLPELPGIAPPAAPPTGPATEPYSVFGKGSTTLSAPDIQMLADNYPTYEALMEHLQSTGGYDRDAAQVIARQVYPDNPYDNPESIGVLGLVKDWIRSDPRGLFGEKLFGPDEQGWARR